MKSWKLASTLAAAALLALLSAAPASAQLVAFTQSFCGDWNNANTSQSAGSSNILQLHGMSSSGSASSTPCSMPMNDGTYTWTVRHGTVDTTDPTSRGGTEHGVFSYSGSDPTPGST